MRTAKKKVLFVLMIGIISAVSLVGMSAMAGSGLTLDDIDFTYEGMSTEQAEQIVRSMFGIQGEYIMIQPFIFCFGNHNISTGSVTTMEHNAYSTNPRCRRSMQFVEYCTRAFCSHFETTRTSVSRIVCC
jgi:cob(I)alamin adenosyltransferase